MVMKFHPRVAPIKAAVFPLVKKDGMPEIAPRPLPGAQEEVPRVLRREGRRGPPLPPPGRGRHAVLRDGRRPDAYQDQTVTLRDRDSLEQVRVKLDDVVEEIERRVTGA